ncbi:Alkanesulfonate monooxygenase [Burkholderia sp. lig30]|jgi:alkanesulfonate monooxygenase|uniref:LLM class flavin-dependent oxidoreductase n=1 Tax=Burkholderia sp. lig30 TaxID=1192124 RepID=UPI000460C0B9|nr:LLM class flavin-dependent oxidoreductase [Burkholderia sp. lig30]KDB06486.1 Alkanesulfonate monooxygenase [Burkholderia sp. lig30]
MPVDIIGMITATPGAEVDVPGGAAVQPDYVRRFAHAHEAAGFDQILVGHFSNAADGVVVAACATAATERIRLLHAHRPGVIAPSAAARQIATLDVFSGGRLAINIVSGGDDADLQRDGDFLPHDARYRRTDEYLDVLKRIWRADTPVDHDGEFYRLRGASPLVKGTQAPHVPIYFGGSSAAALAVAGRHADVYMTWGEPLASVREQIARVRAAAAPHGRAPRISVSFRPIVADTEGAAWAKAEAIRARVRATRLANGQPIDGHAPQNAGSQRLMAAAAQGDVLDDRLWMGVANLTGARWNSTALVGTPAQIASALGAYYRLGVTTFLMRGFDPLDDAIEYGRALIPAIHAHIAELDRQGAALPA